VDSTVPLANFRFRREAVMASELLTQAGIPSVIQSAELSGFGPLAGGATVLVRPDDRERAHGILLDAGLLETDNDAS
jgi:hypothetical protein